MNTQSFAFTLVSILATIIPVSLLLWIICNNSNSAETQSPVRWFMSIFLPICIVIHSLGKKKLDLTGGLTALIVGFLLTLGSYCFTVSLLVFFFTASRLTQFKASKKRKFDENYSSQRTWIQVVCNGGISSLLSLLYILEKGGSGSGTEYPVNFTQDYNSSWFAMSVLGAIACSCGDTWASEVGSVFSAKDPVLIFSFRRVPRGTNGGVSLIGLLMSGLGGMAVGFGFYLTILVFVPRDILMLSPTQLPVIVVGAAAGFFGSLFDSFLGANFQFSGQDMITNKIVEVPGDRVRWISGVALLDNHSVNLISSLMTALFTPKFAQWIWSYYEPGSVPYS